MSSALLDAIKVRRTYYSLSKSSTISDEQLKTIVETAVLHVPSSFNIQAGRVVLLTGKSSDKLWSLVKDDYIKTLGGDEAAIALYSKKIGEYSEGYGTVLFFEDQEIIETMCAKMPHLSHCFPVWSENSTGMLQFTVWVALCNEGMGASLQHYGAYSEALTPTILKEFGLPSTWKSTAMMPFGVATGPPGNPSHPKTFSPIETRVKVFN